MRILGIETSCDETAIALVKGQGDSVKIEKNLISSQIDLHKKTGGIVPEVAARSHVEVIFPMLIEAGIPHDGKGIDAIAVTAGPGLLPALRIGVELGKTLAWIWNKPLVAVNHLEGHIYSVWFDQTPKFPALCLLVSGGHTELILMKDHGDYELIGMTRDDAAGEAFDKVAKLLGLGYPGGPVISKKAKNGNAKAIKFPRPMLDSRDFDFSFSGLKTAVSVYLKENPPVPPLVKGGASSDSPPARGGVRGGGSLEDVAASFQESVVETLAVKTRKVMEKYEPASLIVAGGVSANKRLRQEFPDAYFPALELTGDNAAMIAAAGYFRMKNNNTADPLTLVPDPNLRLV